jgi:manganese/zinc/iron transport system permease protein
MMRTLEPYLLLCLTSTVCVLPGVILVLRRLSMLADAIGHVLLLGIVVAFSLVGDLKSPWLFFGAAGSGLLTVVLVQWLQQDRRFKQDAAIGLVFPALFSLGVLLVSMNFSNIHLDVDAVLLGVPEQTLLDRPEWEILGWSPPRAILILGSILLLQWCLFTLCFKELKLSIFDATQASLFGLMPLLLHYLQMALTSITAVAVFDAVGPVLLLGFMVLPAMTARLLTDSYLETYLWAIGLGISGSIIGVASARAIDSTTPGTVAVVLGIQFLLIWCVQLISKSNNRRRSEQN